jgi:N-acetylglucosaminyldiphosphoundecaprenol N-acetyl-beta-D-mannosaminyltransferase
MTAMNQLPTPKIEYLHDHPTLGGTAAPTHGWVPASRRISPVLLYGLMVDPLTMDQVIERCEEALQTRQRLLIGVVNAAKVVAMGRDEMLRESLLDCNLMLADGQSVVWASRLLRRRLPERVTGIDLFERLLIHAEQQSRSVFLLGATDAVLDSLQTNLQAQFPKLKIAGVRNGYFTEAESADVAEQIRSSGADMLFAGMSSPKKENFFADFGASLGVPIQHGVGGSFDIFAGVTKRAPLRWQKLGLEWAYRIGQEPRRMWRRYLTTNTAFLLKTPVEMFRPCTAYAKRPSLVIDLRDSARPLRVAGAPDRSSSLMSDSGTP